MIEELRIKNFQAHEELRIKLSKHITTLTGPSDAGKSAVIRALGWLAFNRPRGDTHIRYGADMCAVMITAEGRKVGRRRGGSTNEYKLDGEVFKAFGSDVPEQVQDVLQVDSDLNFQTQHDAPFWVSLSSAEVARQLNQIVDLGAVDEVAKQLATKHRAASAKESVLLDQIKEADERIKSLEPVKALDESLSLAESLRTKRKETAIRSEALRLCIRIIEAKQQDNRRAEGALEFYELAIMAHKRCQEVKQTHQQLKDILRKLEMAAYAAKNTPPDWRPAEELQQKAVEAKQKREQLRELIDRLLEKAKEVSQYEQQATDAEERLRGYAKTCPTCGQPWRGSD